MSTHNYSTFEDLNTLFTSLGGKLRSKPTAVELTQAEYDALSQAEKEDLTKIYYVTDAGGAGGRGVWGYITGTLSNQTDLQNALNAKQNTLTLDNIPTENSTNFVTSGGIYSYIDTMITQALTGSY